MTTPKKDEFYTDVINDKSLKMLVVKTYKLHD